MNKKKFSFLVFLLLMPLCIFANYSYDCNEVGSVLGLTDAADGSGNKAYDVSSNNFTGGPWYSFRLDENSRNYVFYPLTNVFSISESNSDSIMVLNHWCFFDGELSDYYGDCECESVREISGGSGASDNTSGYYGVFSNKEKADMMINEYQLSVSSYGSNCLLNNAIAWFRFDYAAKNPDNPLPPRLYFDQNFIKNCTYGSIYKVWAECSVHQYDEVFFDDPQNPVALTPGKPAFYFTDYQTYLEKSPYCKFFALTDDPFKNIISFSTASTADRTVLKSQTGFEHPVVESSGADVKIDPSSEVWWSASPVYRARKLDEEKFEVVILTAPSIDECVPAGEYIYFFTDHSCSDPEAECRNYEGVSIGKNVFNSNCPYPEYYSVVMNYELEPLFVEKPFLPGENPPSYNNYFNSCTILPGEILKRLKLNAVEENIPPRLIYDFDKDILKLESCSKEKISVEKVTRICTDDRRSGVVFDEPDNPVKVEHGAETLIDLLKPEEESCYFDCSVQIKNDSPENSVIQALFRNGSDPLLNATVLTLIQGKEKDSIHCTGSFKAEILIKNNDCIQMENPEISVFEYAGQSGLSGGFKLEYIPGTAKLVNRKDRFDISSEKEKYYLNLKLSGILQPAEDVTVSAEFRIADVEYYDDSEFLLNYSIKHKNISDPVMQVKFFSFYCSGEEEILSSDSSGCAMGL